MTGVAGTGYRFNGLQDGGHLALRRKDVRRPRKIQALHRIVTLFPRASTLLMPETPRESNNLGVARLHCQNQGVELLDRSG